MNSKQIQLIKDVCLKEDSWDFTEAVTQDHTHGLHPYPARMIPQIAETLLNNYVKSHNSGIVADIFCGSGTVIVESSIKGLPSIGIDINPFAIFLSKAKLTVIKNVEKLKKVKGESEEYIKNFKGNFDSKHVPTFSNLEHWFKEPIIVKLAYLKQYIASIEEPDIKRIFLSAFCRTVMDSSNVDWRSSRYIRVFPEKILAYRSPDVFGIFQRSVLDIEHRIKTYMNKRKGETLIIRGDALNTPLNDQSVNLIITSPPYGEERNTIPYMRWSKLFLFWLGMDAKKITEIEKKSIGGNPSNDFSETDIPSTTFWHVADNVDKKRIMEALPFMKDYFISLKEMNRILKPNGLACIVIGHRSIQRNLIDMGEVTKEYGLEAGFKCEAIHKRRIPKKLIAWQGPTGATISNESIVILKKE